LKKEETIISKKNAENSNSKSNQNSGFFAKDSEERVIRAGTTPNKIEFNLNLGSIGKKESYNKPVDIIRSDHVNDFKSSDEDSPGHSDEEQTERHPEKSLDDEEFKRIIASSHKNNEGESLKKSLNSSDKNNQNKDHIVIAVNSDSNYNLLGKTSSDKSKSSARINELEIVLKNNTGSTSTRNKDGKDNNDFIAEIKAKANCPSNREKK
jgi:hypothetical protein